jgi:RNA polymerase sigma-70 factor (ECF subfamily)
LPQAIADALTATPTDDARQARFLRLLAPHRAELRAQVRSVIWDRALAEDVLQEIWLVLWVHLDDYDPARPFGPWARGVAARVSLQALQRLRRDARALSPEIATALTAAHEREAQRAPEGAYQEALAGCVARLPERSARLLRLRYQHELKLDEIAARLGSTADAVRMALTRVRLGLQRCIERKLAREEA